MEQAQVAFEILVPHGLGFWTDRSAVHKAAAHGRAAELQQLIKNGALVNIVAVNSITPLHEACIQGQTQCIQLLLEAGAHVNRCNRVNLECLKLLLEYGAMVNLPFLHFMMPVWGAR
ncbi:hypothetical protein KOW79_004503 [Hemibagrus wyckioides]|uniref:Uncharacterized protein n=1 Tax=Hemibagrus wyckioides TaxID=337641 RepID=A0A9D3P2X6_9TELE|nr:hypothetical protein KOW79_004503 [Hemibagrus wyckioides]